MPTGDFPPVCPKCAKREAYGATCDVDLAAKYEALAKLHRGLSRLYYLQTEELEALKEAAGG